MSKNNQSKAFSMKTTLSQWWVILLMCFLVSCSSSPVPDKHYYVLSSHQYAQNTQPKMLTNTPKISIRTVKLPYYLNQQGIVRLKNNGQIVLSGHQRWGERLSRSIPLLLSQAMAVQLSQPVEIHPLPAGVKVKQTVDVIISNFVANDKQLFLSATYRITQNNQLKSFQLNHSVHLEDETMHSLIDAYAQGIYHLGTVIINQLR